jgi:hypothetical protein
LIYQAKGAYIVQKPENGKAKCSSYRMKVSSTHVNNGGIEAVLPSKN